MKGEIILKMHDSEQPFPLTLKAYNNRPLSERRYVFIITYNSAKHSWDYLTTIWGMINEEILADKKSSDELLKGLDIEKLKMGVNTGKIDNYISSPEFGKRLSRTAVYLSSFYIYARIFLDRSATIYPILTSYHNMPQQKRESLPNQYYWLKKNKSKEDLPYFQILEKHWSNLSKNIIDPRNKLITHGVGLTEQFRMGEGKPPRIMYNRFSLEYEKFMLKLIKKYGDLIKEDIPHPKKDAPNTIKKLIEHKDKLDSDELIKLMKIKNKMVEELPAIEDVMECINNFRLELDKCYSNLIERGMLNSCD